MPRHRLPTFLSMIVLVTGCGGGDDTPATAVDSGAPADSGVDATTVDTSDTNAPPDEGLDVTTDDGTDAGTDAFDATDSRDSGPPCPDGGCGAGLTCCAGSCVDTTKDPLNCGACSKACALTQFCTGTKCSEAVFANVCDNPNATVLKDPYP